ncbi:hypothetical protein A3D77_01345 [Candidatus Gottesmanbacteria bacterium RIFCSPHIGHO2_02_FULL_39_11]|uniref:TraC-like domain-containing protein n=1 Tax=Candidatus Gottesmanbacteria bacterium RIFCSPHIGHO2_02_FULL_39_11 TaxID=1798382 RepID=A0A1F5ZTK2_9BACT|nr:MAG: hypothetical protein A3D77_01345 [Candidatus Gottesmanbacteria bacterium RIFCSPHIGHO2_02_FULL_39_11]
MASPIGTPIRASTQDFLDIQTILDDIIVLRDGSCAIAIETTAVNFGLLSEEEQDALIYAYAAFLNSLSFPLQIVILSKRMDISLYIERITREEERQVDETVRQRLKRYKEFIMSIVKENRVLEKKFYLVISFSAVELGVKGAFQTNSQKKKFQFSMDYVLSRAKTSLLPKRDHVLRQIGRIGLKGRQLTTQELVEIFYNIYNPTLTGEKLGDVAGYETAMVTGQGKKSS